MGFGVTKEEVAAAKIDKYIINRLKAALYHLKQCRSKEEAIDYHTVLTAVAPTRETAGDQDGMIAKVGDTAQYGSVSTAQYRSVQLSAAQCGSVHGSWWCVYGWCG